MKIATSANPDFVEDEVGEFESYEAEISQDDPGFTFELLSSRLYSNKEGSIVREITSNCFDAHTAINKPDHPVFIKLYREEGQWFLAFKDEGPGMSPKFIKDVYMKYLKSTKRDSNAFIGAYGLGSKSPLSYTDFFYLTTRVDGIEWQYMMHKTKRAPRIELLVQLETEEPNGTFVKIPLKDEDLPKFKAELIRQLFYFTNVFVEGGNTGFDNHYIVYDFKTFKYRPMVNYAEEWYKEMHIVIDKVTYPIDWTALRMPAIKASVGLKFEIGELDIPPNRESVEYSDESVTLIKKRIEEARSELTQIANNDRTKICSTIQIYNDRTALLEKEGKWIILMNDENVKLTLTRNTNTPLTPFFLSQVSPFRWKPLAHLPISFKETPFFEYNISKQVGELGTVKLMKNNMNSYLLTPNVRKMVLVEPNEAMGRLKNYQLGSGTYIVTRSKLIYKHRRKQSEDKQDTFWDKVTIEGVKNAKKSPFAVGGFNKTFLMREYRRIIAAELHKYCPNYKDIVVTEQTKISYRSHFDKRVKREQGIIAAIYAAPGNAKYDKNSKVDIDTADIENYKGILVFGTKEQYSLLKNVAEILEMPSTNRYDSNTNIISKNPSIYVFAAAEKSTNRFIKPLQATMTNLFSYEQIANGECDIFNDKVAHNLLAKKIKESQMITYYSTYRYKNVRFFSETLYKSLQALSNFTDKYKHSDTISLMFSGNQTTKILSKIKPFKEAADFERCASFFKGLSLLGTGYHDLELNDENSGLERKKDIILYLKMKGKGKEINEYHNIILTDEEREFREKLRKMTVTEATEFRKTVAPRLAPFILTDPFLKNFIF